MLSGDIADENRDPPDLLACHEGQAVAVASGGQDSRVGDVDVLADEVQIGFAGGQQFAFDFCWPYIASLVYLSLFGSAVAFGAYLTLMRRIGADRASYTAVAIPVVALLLSTAFEHLRWHPATFIGVALCVAGTVLMLRRRRA